MVWQSCRHGSGPISRARMSFLASFTLRRKRGGRPTHTIRYLYGTLSWNAVSTLLQMREQEGDVRILGRFSIKLVDGPGS
jgi:hypothetical protein